MTTAAAPVTPVQASTTTTPTVSATKDAATRGDFLAFEKGREAAREGKPLPDVALGATNTPAPAPPKRPNAAAAAAAAGEAPVEGSAPPENRKTREDKEQDRINASIRAGIEAETRELRAELARLKAGPTAERPAGQTSTDGSVPGKGTPEWKRFAAMAEAPKLEDFESVGEHTAAMAFFIADKMLGERDQRAQAQTRHSQAQAADEARFEAWHGRIGEAKAADPEFVTKLSPAVQALKPFGALPAGDQGGPANFIAEQIVNSAIAPTVMLYLSQHDDELTRLQTMPESIARIADERARISAHMRHMQAEFFRLEGRLAVSPAAPPRAPAAAAAEPPPVISQAPPPADTITRARTSSDPRQAAIAKGDVRSYMAIEDERQRDRAAARR